MAIQATTPGTKVNQTKAAIDAGYSKATALKQASRLMGRTDIRRAIDSIIALYEDKAAREQGITRSTLIRQAQDMYEQARRLNQVSAGVSALRLQAEMVGALREQAPNPERAGDNLTEDERKAYADAARRVAIGLSKGSKQATSA